MSDDNKASMSLFDKEHASREKYIYFLCSVAGVLVAYIGRDFKPNHPLSNHDRLTLWCLGCLTGSFIFGLGRILTYIHGLSFNREMVYCEEELAKHNKALVFHLENQGNGTPVSLATKTSAPLTEEDILGIIEVLRKQIDKNKVGMNRWYNWATFFLLICELSLAAGFVLLLLSKILS